MDEADLAEERIEREMQQLLKRRAAAGLAPTGYCLWCAEPLELPLRWCDADCRDDWEREHERQRHPR